MQSSLAKYKLNWNSTAAYLSHCHCCFFMFSFYANQSYYSICLFHQVNTVAKNSRKPNKTAESKIKQDKTKWDKMERKQNNASCFHLSEHLVLSGSFLNPKHSSAEAAIWVLLHCRCNEEVERGRVEVMKWLWTAHRTWALFIK